MTAERVYFARAWRVAVQLSDGKLEVVLREIMGMTDTEYLAWFDTLDHPQS